MSKEEFLEILSRQQQSGLTIKDFCVNEAYSRTVPNFPMHISSLRWTISEVMSSTVAVP